MSLTGETKFFIGIIGATALILIGAVVIFSRPSKEVSPEVLSSNTSWATGSANPKATLVEFSDFECPSCAQAFPEVIRTVQKYKDDLRYVYRHFPLPKHANARKAAEAAEAAGVQGKFWEMHDLLFQNQSNLSEDNLLNLANKLGLDVAKFSEELKSGKFTQTVDKDIADAIKLGINSTPTFYLDGKKLKLFSYSDLEKEIQKALNN